MDIRNLDITKFLPHRAPFLMVDHLLSFDDEHVSTSFKINPDCVFVNDNVFNEVGLIENAAQTCSSIVGKSYFEDDDLEWAEICSKRVSEDCMLYLQSEWSRFSINIGNIVDYAKNNPKWMVSLQSHKFMKIP